MPSPVRPSAAGFTARSVALAALALSALGVHPLAGQTAPAKQTGPDAPPAVCRRIGRIDIRNNSLFAPEEIHSKNFGWALGAVNHIHYRTRADYLRKALLVNEGGCYDES